MMLHALFSVPSLILRHRSGGCIHFRPHEAENNVPGLYSAKAKQFILLDGGHSQQSDACAWQNWHGFINFERETVAEIVEWIGQQ